MVTTMENTAHEIYCVLARGHYGPCASAESEFYVADNDDKVLWRQPLALSPGYSTAPDSEYVRAWRPAYERAKAECLEAAFRLGRLPMRRHHSRHTDAVEWFIAVREIEEYGDLELTLPVGRFRLKARRARKGERIDEIGIDYRFAAMRFGVAIEGRVAFAVSATDTPPVRLRGRVLRRDTESVYVVQPAEIEYADGMRSGEIGNYPMEIERIANGADVRPEEHLVAGE